MGALSEKNEHNLSSYKVYTSLFVGGDINDYTHVRYAAFTM